MRKQKHKVCQVALISLFVFFFWMYMLQVMNATFTCMHTNLQYVLHVHMYMYKKSEIWLDDIFSFYCGWTIWTANIFSF